MNCSTPGFPVHHYLPEFAEIHCHWVSDAIQPSCPLSPPFPPAIFPSIRIFSNELSLRISDQSIAASTSVLPVNIQGWFPLGLIGLISFLSKGLSRVFSSITIQKHKFFGSHLYMTIGKTIALTRWTFVGKVMSLLFHMLSGLVITFLPRSKSLFNFATAVTICCDFGEQKYKIWHCFHFFPIYLPWNDGTGCHDLSFYNAEF